LKRNHHHAQGAIAGKERPMDLQKTYSQFVAHLEQQLAPIKILAYWYRREPLNYLIVTSSPPVPQAVDDACFTWQDQNPWPWNHWLVNTPARLNIWAPGPRILPLNLVPQDIEEILAGKWGSSNPSPDLIAALNELSPRLETIDLQSLTPKKQPTDPGLAAVCDLEWCRKRGE